MPPSSTARPARETVPAALASLLLVGGIAAGLVFSLAASSHAPPIAGLQAILVSLRQSPPPPPPTPPRRELSPKAPRPAGRTAAPPAPPAPLIPLAVTVPVPPVPIPAAGTLVLPGYGSGAGSSGAGNGGGGAGGNGSGGEAGPATPAVQLSGRLSARDLPHDVLLPGGSLSVGVAYMVGIDGRVRDCMVTSTSGYLEADALVCRLLTQRFRYRPARDRAGHPVPSPVRETHSWARRAQEPASAG